jgi:hypothetical protein
MVEGVFIYLFGPKCYAHKHLRNCISLKYSTYGQATSPLFLSMDALNSSLSLVTTLYNTSYVWDLARGDNVLAKCNKMNLEPSTT